MSSLQIVLGLCLTLLLGCSNWQAGDLPIAAGPAPQVADTCKVTSGAGGENDGSRCGPAFAAGVNVAWLQFASDVPSPQLCGFKALFTNVNAAGGRVIRWWLHTDGSVTPGYDAAGYARAISASDIDDVRAVLDLAEASNVMLVISLWSFDMLRGGPVDNNRLLLSDDAHRQAYIDNVLTPLASALAGHKALYAWEAFNEAEGMSQEFGWLVNKLPMKDIQRSVNWFGSAIHAADSAARFTTGCWSFPACSSLPGYSNYYADDELARIGERPNGGLDFYEVHYYSSDGLNASPFAHPAAYWMLDKPIVVGEFWATDTDGVNRDDLFTHLHDTGYAGAWAWQYANSDGASDFRWPAMQQGLENLRDAEPASLQIACE